MKLSPHFTLRELTKSNTAIRLGIDNTPSQDIISNLSALACECLQIIRWELNTPLIISSGYRSPALNKAIGGSPTSQHMRGEAADFESPTISNLALFELIKRSGIPFDCLYLEFHNPKIKHSGWLHISYRTVGNRNITKVIE